MATVVTQHQPGLSRAATLPASQRPVPVFPIGAAFGAALLLAGAILVVKGTDSPGIVTALRVTARWSFLLFWIAYAGKATAKLFGPTFEHLARGRDFGLAYGAAQLIHILLVVRLFHISPTPPLSGNLFWFFVIAIVWTYLLVLFSFGRLVEILGPRGWRALRLVGMNYILLAFARDFVPPVLHSWGASYGRSLLIEYLPFAAMCIAAPVLVIAAAARRRLAMNPASEPASV